MFQTILHVWESRSIKFKTYVKNLYHYPGRDPFRTPKRTEEFNLWLFYAHLRLYNLPNLKLKNIKCLEYQRAFPSFLLFFPSFILLSFLLSFLLAFLPSYWVEVVASATTFTQYERKEGKEERRKEGKKEGRKERRKEGNIIKCLEYQRAFRPSEQEKVCSLLCVLTLLEYWKKPRATASGNGQVQRLEAAARGNG